MWVRPWWVIWAVSLAVAASSFVRLAHAADGDASLAGVEAYREFKLKNGLHVALAVDRRVPQVAVRVEYSVGEALDPPNERGLARLIAAILAKLDTRHVHASERTRLFRAAAVTYDEPNVDVDFDSTALNFQVAPEALELALWLEADRMGFAADGVSESMSQKGVKALARATSAETPEYPVRAALLAGLGSNHPYGTVAGTPNFSSIRATTVGARLRRYYNPASATLVLVGDLELGRTEQAVRRIFGSLLSAPLTPLRVGPQDSLPGAVSMTAAVRQAASALVWETPRFLDPDDAALDIVATILERRLATTKLCGRIGVAQRSYQLASVFVASCVDPTGKLKAWQAEVEAELASLAGGRISNQEVEAAVLRFERITSERSDDLESRARYLALLIRSGHAMNEFAGVLKRYSTIGATQVASVVHRNLQRPPKATLRLTPLLAGKHEHNVSVANAPQTFQFPAEASRKISKDSSDWLRPPGKGTSHPFFPQAGITDTLPGGDQMRFLERRSVPLAYAAVRLPWPTSPFNPSLRSVLAALLKQTATAGGTLQEGLKTLGAELAIDATPSALDIQVTAPSSKFAASLLLVREVLANKVLSKDGLEAAKKLAKSWVDAESDGSERISRTLGLSAPTTRYRYLTHSLRETLLTQLTYADLVQGWGTIARGPRGINLIGPFDGTQARTLASMLARQGGGRNQPISKVQASTVFKPGVYLLDTSESKYVEGCLLFPIAPWGTEPHLAAHLLTYLFRPEGEFGARLKEHNAKLEYWESNTALTPDGDFFRYTFWVPVGDVAPVLKAVKAHLTRVGSGQIAKIEFDEGRADELAFQLRRALSGYGLLGVLDHARTHHAEASVGTSIPVRLERVTQAQLAELASSLTLEKATIGLFGPADDLTDVLSGIGLKPSSVTKDDSPTVAKEDKP